MTAAANAVDAFTYRTLRLLSHNPIARLAFLGYLALLHGWCLSLLLFHTHALPHEAHAHGPRPPGPPGGLGK
jgi:hypothetical protein